jgi:vacuolar protein 8
VQAGAVPVLVALLNSPDPDIQYYCTTAISNIAVDPTNRERLAQNERGLVISLVKLMAGESELVAGQAALASRNLASDGICFRDPLLIPKANYQLDIVRNGGLTPLAKLITSNKLPLIMSAVACIRNISIHPLNESPIIDSGFLPFLVKLLERSEDEVLCHTVITMRNVLPVLFNANQLAGGIFR